MRGLAQARGEPCFQRFVEEEWPFAFSVGVFERRAAGQEVGAGFRLDLVGCRGAEGGAEGGKGVFGCRRRRRGVGVEVDGEREQEVGGKFGFGELALPDRGGEGAGCCSSVVRERAAGGSGGEEGRGEGLAAHRIHSPPARW